MHKKVRKMPKALVLNRETLRNLEVKELNGIAGAFSLPPAQCGDSNDTCDNCYTYSCGLYRCL